MIEPAKYNDDNKLSKIFEAIYIFIIAGVLGWVVEIIYIYLYYGKLADRGICYGPFCTIYGVASLIIYLIYGNIKASKKNVAYVFFSATIILGIFELATGLIFKYLLGVELWNYDSMPLEILNYTTVPIALGWGLAATVYTFLIQPILLKIIHLIPVKISGKLAILLIVIYFVDYSASIFHVFNNPELLHKLVTP